ncbi:hypothetical protein [Actinoplanes sp. NPDC049802]|uniref:hypothetical protein n=1 Tax=Actinoplanes sp. NPDC049802 TaxID=3154742 RepID=UPI00340CA0E2
MHRPFMRVAVVLALLVCALTVHGHHREGSGHEPAAVTTTVDGRHAGAVFDLTAVSELTAVSPAAAHGPHESHGDACGDASSVHRPAGSVTPLLAAVPVSLAVIADGDAGWMAPPPVWHGRSLLLLGCVSRT